MKQCPKCSRVYADNSLRFCLDDGSGLISSAAAQPTLRIPGQGTTQKTEVFPTSRPANQPSRSVVPWVIAGAAILVAVVVVMVSLGVLIFAGKTSSANNSNFNRSPSPTPTPSPAIVDLAGTRWKDTYANIQSKDYYFSPNGTINNSSTDTWQQNGRTVILIFNDGYARYEGTINGNTINYKARNKLNFEWSATIVRNE